MSKSDKNNDNDNDNNDDNDNDNDNDNNDDNDDNYNKYNDDLDDVEKFYMKDIIVFYKNDKYLNILLSIVVPENNDRISLRLLEWFVTNYVKKYGTYYKIKQHGIIDVFIVYTDYKAKLKAYKKHYFDPFCRGSNIYFPYSSNGQKKVLMTSISQLNFFKWAIKYKIIDYVRKHFNDIDQDMKKPRNLDEDTIESTTSDNSVEKLHVNELPFDPEICSSENFNHINLSNDHRSKSNVKSSKKRQELSVSVYKTVKKIQSPPKLYFN
jgi:hypothetical protein